MILLLYHWGMRCMATGPHWREIVLSACLLRGGTLNEITGNTDEICLIDVWRPRTRAQLCTSTHSGQIFSLTLSSQHRPQGCWVPIGWGYVLGHRPLLFKSFLNTIFLYMQYNIIQYIGGLYIHTVVLMFARAGHGPVRTGDRTGLSISFGISIKSELCNL